MMVAAYDTSLAPIRGFTDRVAKCEEGLQRDRDQRSNELSIAIFFTDGLCSPRSQC